MAGEFASRALDAWAYRKGVTLDFSRPGKPTDNAVVVTFNYRMGLFGYLAHPQLSAESSTRSSGRWTSSHSRFGHWRYAIRRDFDRPAMAQA